MPDFKKSGMRSAKTAQEYLDQGNGRFDLQDYLGAIANYNEAIKLNPNNTRAFYYRSRAEILLRDPMGAIDDLTKAVEIPLMSKSVIW